MENQSLVNQCSPHTVVSPPAASVIYNLQNICSLGFNVLRVKKKIIDQFLQQTRTIHQNVFTGLSV